jgi:hypothetical protein
MGIWRRKVLEAVLLVRDSATAAPVVLNIRDAEVEATLDSPTTRRVSADGFEGVLRAPCPDGETVFYRDADGGR